MANWPGEFEGDAALLFISGQYLFCRRDRDKGTVSHKFISAAAVRAAFALEPIDSGWLLPGVRRWGSGTHGDWAVLFAPPDRRQVLFANFANDRFPNEETITLDLPLPGLVFAGVGSSYYVWAVAEADFNPSLHVYHAPLPNVNSSGQICFGINTVGKNIDGAWKLFWESPFNDHEVNGKSKRFPDDVRQQLLSLAHLPARGGQTGKRRRVYPTNDLEPLHAAVEQVVGRLLREP